MPYPKDTYEPRTYTEAERHEDMMRAGRVAKAQAIADERKRIKEELFFTTHALFILAQNMETQGINTVAEFLKAAVKKIESVTN
jgi:hypothetical protein